MKSLQAAVLKSEFFHPRQKNQDIFSWFYIELCALFWALVFIELENLKVML